ncbi:hypothetical protein [Halocola ammonii]
MKLRIATASVFLWIGFVCAISFMDAWLKFKAPGIDLKLGLGIGRLVFGALNKVEWVLALAIVADVLLAKSRMLKSRNLFPALAVTILLIQTFWLLPELDSRAELILQDEAVPESGLHIFYVIVELIKVVSLVIFGVQLLKQNHHVRNTR